MKHCTYVIMQKRMNNTNSYPLWNNYYSLDTVLDSLEILAHLCPHRKSHQLDIISSLQAKKLKLRLSYEICPKSVIKRLTSQDSNPGSRESGGRTLLPSTPSHPSCPQQQDQAPGSKSRRGDEGVGTPRRKNKSRQSECQILVLNHLQSLCKNLCIEFIIVNLPL